MDYIQLWILFNYGFYSIGFRRELPFPIRFKCRYKQVRKLVLFETILFVDVICKKKRRKKKQKLEGNITTLDGLK